MRTEQDKTIYFHIGLPKTGSSAIQQFLNANRELLKTFSIDYPPFQEAQKTVATHGNFSLFLAALREGNQARLAQAVAHCAASPCRNIIFSEEQLTMLSKDKLKELCALFHEFPIKIICYLRRQDHHHTSLANQMTFAAGITDFSAPLTGAFAVFNDLSQLVEIFEEIFGKENMIFRIYEKQQFHGGNLFADFLDIFHVPLNEAFSLPERVNPPLARDFLEILRLCNTLPLPHSFVLNTMEPQLYELARCFDDRAVFATPELFSPQERCEILKKYAAFNARIARAYLGRENGKLFLEPEPSPDDPWSPYGGIPQETLIKTFFYFYLNLAQKLRDESLLRRLSGKRLCAWGIGRGYQEILAPLIENFPDEIQVDCLVDSNPAKQGSEINGLRILSPEQACKRNFDYICITAFYVDSVQRELKTCGLDHIPCLSLI